MLWVKSLETGMPKIDAQHKQLFEQMDLLLDSANANRHKEVMNFLDQYILKHFGDEQQMHKDAKYPKAEAHKKYHDQYVAIFHKIKEKYLKEGPTAENNIEINKTVAGWLKDHIMVHDKEFAAYQKTLSK